MSRYATTQESASAGVTDGVSAATTIESKTPTPPGICEASPPTWAAMNSARSWGNDIAAPCGSRSQSTSAASAQSAAETATWASASGSDGGLTVKPRIESSRPRWASARYPATIASARTPTTRAAAGGSGPAPESSATPSSGRSPAHSCTAVNATTRAMSPGGRPHCE